MQLSCRSIRPDTLNAAIEAGEAFLQKKSDLSTTAGIIKGNVLGSPQDLWVKRFNYRGFFDYLVKMIFGGRARRIWKINGNLYKRGLPVPMPVTFLEETFKHKQSFFISAIIEKSDDLGSIYVKGEFDESAQFAQQLATTIAAWHLAGAVHGDLKWSNILLQESGSSRKFFFIDLDQAKLYSRPKIKGIIKDLGRFYRYGLELGAQAWVESKFFPEYVAALPAELREIIDLENIKNRSLKIWQQKGSRRLPANH